MLRTFTVLLLLLADHTLVLGQDAREVTGVWQGHFRSNSSPKKYFPEDDRYKFEVQIALQDKAIRAVTYSYQSSVFYGKADATGTLNAKTGKVLLQETKITEMRMQGGTDACIMTCFLQYSKSGDEEFLEGTYVSMNTRDSSNCGKGTVFLRRAASSDFYKEPFLVKKESELAKTGKTAKTPATSPKPVSPKPVPPAPVAKTSPAAKAPTAKKTVPKTGTPGPAPGKTTAGARGAGQAARNAPHKEPLPGLAAADATEDKPERRAINAPAIIPKVLTARANEIVQTVSSSSNEIVLNIYDNGAIDNDTISVYLDKRLVVSHARLTEKAIVVKVHLDEENDYHELVMVADNEGDIPPNTSLMVVKAGEKEYEIRIASSEQKNAVVIFRYEKK